MKRRKALHQINLLTASTLLTPTLFLQCSSDEYQPIYLSASEYQLVDALSEFILPTNQQSPGARQAKVSNYLDIYIHTCKPEAFQLKLKESLSFFDDECKRLFRKRFQLLDEAEKGNALLHPGIAQILETSSLRQLILFAYFTSQIGMTEALNYIAVPGKYEGSIKYQNGQGAWAI